MIFKFFNALLMAIVALGCAILPVVLYTWYNDWIVESGPVAFWLIFGNVTGIAGLFGFLKVAITLERKFKLVF